MKRVMITSVAVLAWFSGGAMAAGCDGNYLTGPEMTALLTNRTVCSPANCSGSACQWQEEHLSGGQLWDYKKGPPPETVDPRAQVGTWNVTVGSSSGGPSQIVHKYGPAEVYGWQIKQESAGFPGSYIFCAGVSGPYTFTVKDGTNIGC